jgi:predicted RecB family nuclease
MTKTDRDLIPIFSEMQPSSWATLGNDYEAEVIRLLSQGSSVLLPSAGEENLSQRMSSAFLQSKRPEEYAYQLVLEETPTLRKVLELTPNIEIRRSKPDLVRVDRSGSSPIFQIIDIKAVKHATTFHKAQVAFYSLVLKSRFAELGVPFTVSPIGHIWRMPAQKVSKGSFEVDEFNLEPYERLVIDFFKNELPSIAAKVVSQSFDNTFFHIYFKCEQCQFLQHCEHAIDKNIPAAERDVSAVPGVSHESKRSLLRLQVNSVGAVADLLDTKPVSQMDSWALKRRAETLAYRAKALVSENAIRIPGVATYLMPPAVNVSLFLVLDIDPVENNIAAIGYLRSENGKENFEIEVLQTGEPHLERNALIKVLGQLISDLTEIDHHNKTTNDPNLKKQAHIFLYEPSEAVGLQEAVARHLQDSQVRNGLLHLVRMFPPEDVVPEPEFRGVHHLPATALRSVVEQVYALPVMVSYDLRQVTESLVSTEQGFQSPYIPEPAFFHKFSSRLSVDVCRQMREGKINPITVRDDVKSRLISTRALAEWLFAEN